jgi:hypothetical protein
MSVCDALNTTAIRQKISIHGVIEGSHHHGYYLGQGIGGDPCPGWRRRLFTAPSVISVYITSRPDLPLTKEQERLDLEFMLRVRRIEMERSHKNPIMSVTMTGILYGSPGL